MSTNTVDHLTIEQLRDEVWLWRIDAALRLFNRMDAVKQTRAATRAGREARRDLAGDVETLGDAMAGRYHPDCFACGLPIIPGDAVISDVNEGEMHAECPAEGRERTIKPGDKVFMDRESIVIEEDHPDGGDLADKPDHIVAHAASRLYSDKQIAARLDTARALLSAEAK